MVFLIDCSLVMQECLFGFYSFALQGAREGRTRARRTKIEAKKGYTESLGGRKIDL